MRRPCAMALLALALASCSALPSHPANVRQQRSSGGAVLLVSIDAFRADYLELGITPNLARIAREGVRAQWMNPSYPALTFPNHYTHRDRPAPRPPRHRPEHMHDNVLGAFKASDPTSQPCRSGGVANRSGSARQRPACRRRRCSGRAAKRMIGGRRPDRWQAYDETVTLTTRVDTVLGWLGESAATRPRLSTLYFEAAGRSQPRPRPGFSRSTRRDPRCRCRHRATVRRAGGARFAGAINLVIVSDHGMATVGPGHAIAVEDMVDPADAIAVTTGQSVGFAPLPGRTAAAERRLLGAHPQYECWRKNELPPRWQYGQHPRVPPIVCQMHEGWDALTPERMASGHGMQHAVRMVTIRRCRRCARCSSRAGRVPSWRGGAGVRQRRCLSAAGAAGRHPAGTQRRQRRHTVAGAEIRENTAATLMSESGESGPRAVLA